MKMTAKIILVCGLVFGFATGCAVRPTQKDYEDTDRHFETLRLRHAKAMEEKYGADWLKKSFPEENEEGEILIDHYDKNGRKIGSSIIR